MRVVLVRPLSILAAAALFGTALPGSAAELTEKELSSARKVYVAKCAKCHRFYEPKKYSEPDWDKWMESMSRKSKLNRQQGELLSRYLDQYRAGRLARTH